jgi:2-polyprenyl-3-methyl-5-hydroxy-6-metoxy-1,4-benzoquinol methylase
VESLRIKKNLELILCPICLGNCFTHLFEKNGEPFVECNNCELTLINPRPSLDDIKAGYDASYSSGYTKKAPKKKRRAFHRVKRLKKEYGISGRWLDVGCSAGFVVEAAALHGFQAFGVDIEKAGIDYGRQKLHLKNLAEGTLNEQNYPNNYFSAISAYDVLEHVTDLNIFLKELKRVLHPQGVIDLGTPDIGHWRVPKVLASWNEFKPSEHLYYFNKQTLSQILDKNGLNIDKIRWSMKPGLKVTIIHQ